MGIESIIICATPRSGSTMLCDLMAATGQLGRPESWFRRQSIAEIAAELGVTAERSAPDFPSTYFEAVKAAGTDTSGTFGLRLMAETRPELLGWLRPLYGQLTDIELLAAAFGQPLYVFLGRDDKLAQAVSRLRAEQSGLWHRNADGSVREQVGTKMDPVYDADRIAGFIAEAERDESAWREWFAQAGVTPFTIRYSALSADPAGTMGALLDVAGRDADAARGLAPRTARLADAQSAEWIARFKLERGDA